MAALYLFMEMIMDHHSTTNFMPSEKELRGQSGHWLPALRPESLQQGTANTDSHPPAQSLFDTSSLDNRNVPEDAAEIISRAKLSNYTQLSTVSNDGLAGDADWTQYQENTQPEERSSFQPITESARHSITSPRIFDDDEYQDDEKEARVDPAWGIGRSSTAQFLGSVKHSTTFPDISPSAEFEPDSSSGIFATSQNVDRSPYIQEYQPVSIKSDEQVDFLDRANDDTILDQRDAIGGESTNITSATGIGSSGVRDTADARFEEGIPLVQDVANPETLDVSSEQEQIPEQTARFVEDEEENSFFANIAHTDQHLSGVPALQRKSTDLVLDSLNIDKIDAPDSPKLTQHRVEDSDDQNELMSAINSSARKVADKEETGDLDAMWQAALDDDEFLIEDADDLLPDSDPASPIPFSALLQNNETRDTGSSIQGTAVGTTQIEQTPPRSIRPDFVRQSSSNPYAPHQPSTSDLTQLSPTTFGTVGITRPGLAPMNSFQAHLQQQPTIQSRAESFVDQAKGGYKSPYDLPMEISKPKKRPQVQQPVQVSKQMPPPPPRSSSISDRQLQSPFSPTSPGFPPNSPPQPASNIASVPTRSISASTQPTSASKLKSASSSFFEELPITSKPRSGTGQGRYTPQQTVHMPPPQRLPSSPQVVQASPSLGASPPKPIDPYAQYQLRPPEKIDPFTNTALQPLQPSVPVQSTRYSPAPPNTLPSGPKPTASPRYSPAPPAAPAPPTNVSRYASQPSAGVAEPQPPPLNRYASQNALNQNAAPTALPFQPRTSSPLAYTTLLPGPPPVSKTASTLPYQLSQNTQPPLSTAQPPPSYQQAQTLISPPRPQAVDATASNILRSQTQSPGKQRYQQTAPPIPANTFNRPASAHGQISPTRTYTKADPVIPTRPTARPRGVAEELEFVKPVDDTQFDSLQRWRGVPVFRFGFGGTIATTFPKHVPRYTAGSVRPQIKPTVGELFIRDIKSLVSLPDHISNFPGPLRTKSKKKDVLAWMSAAIASFEADTVTGMNVQSFPESGKRRDEKIILWKILRVLVEHDGNLDTNPAALKAVNAILCPEVHALDDATASQYRSGDITSGSYKPTGATARLETVDSTSLDTLRKHLLKGNRQDAVWHAVDCRLWSHALLISSTLDKSIWKQVVQEFVKQEVKTMGAASSSLSALYEIFGGNLDESIDQLVPPSARAGLQMLSTADSSGHARNALDGLDHWKETLSLVINNRSQGDYQAIATLGRLLGDYGRVEASQICHMFSKNPLQPVIFGGVDEPQASIVLLGADNKTQPFDFARDHEAILLTEIYEFATVTLSSASNMPPMHHLSAYKMYRASLLADVGNKTEAQAYCDWVASMLKSSTKISPYYHPALLGELDELSNRLKQLPAQSSGSWIARPSLDKVSGSMWTKFSSFVAGDDSDADSKGSGKDVGELGPFAKVTGTPSISRSGSQTDLYGMYPTAVPAPAPTTAARSRYAPNGLNSSRSSSELTRGRASLDSQRSPPSSSYSQNGRPSPYEPMNVTQDEHSTHQVNPYQPYGASPPVSTYHATPPQTSYMPKSISHESPIRTAHIPQQEPYIPTPPPEQLSQQTYEPIQEEDLPQAQAPTSQQAVYGAYQPPTQTEVKDEIEPEISNVDDLHSHVHEPGTHSYGYEPPQDTGYTPYVPEPDSGDEQQLKPKKSFMDDDDDSFVRNSRTASKSSPLSKPESVVQTQGVDDADGARKRANDAAADAAFRAAAEADAARGKEKTLKPKSSWFGGWLGGKKEDSLDTSGGSKGGSETKVYKANLGEKKMKLYYDEKLKKWVNPDNPDAALKSTATPPPPRAGGTPAPPMGGPPRAASSLGPPSGPPSRAATPASGIVSSTSASPLPPGMTQALDGSESKAVPPPPPPSAVSSRPTTAMSNASSIDDLIGPATGRKTIKGKKGTKGGRYVDVMAL